MLTYCGFNMMLILLTIRASLSIAAAIFAQNSSQQMFSSAVTTSAEQRANTLYSLDHVDSIDFWDACEKKPKKHIRIRFLYPEEYSGQTENRMLDQWGHFVV